MKALPSIAFNDFSGSAKDVTTRSTSGGTILTVRSYPSRVYSPSTESTTEQFVQDLPGI